MDNKIKDLRSELDSFKIQMKNANELFARCQKEIEELHHSYYNILKFFNSELIDSLDRSSNIITEFLHPKNKQ